VQSNLTPKEKQGTSSAPPQSKFSSTAPKNAGRRKKKKEQPTRTSNPALSNNLVSHFTHQLLACNADRARRNKPPLLPFNRAIASAAGPECSAQAAPRAQCRRPSPERTVTNAYFSPLSRLRTDATPRRADAVAKIARKCREHLASSLNGSVAACFDLAVPLNLCSCCAKTVGSVPRAFSPPALSGSAPEISIQGLRVENRLHPPRDAFSTSQHGEIRGERCFLEGSENERERKGTALDSFARRSWWVVRGGGEWQWRAIEAKGLGRESKSVFWLLWDGLFERGGCAVRT